MAPSTGRSLTFYGVRPFSYHRPTPEIQDDLEKVGEKLSHQSGLEITMNIFDSTAQCPDGRKMVLSAIQTEQSRIQLRQADLYKQQSSLMRELKSAHEADLKDILASSPKIQRRVSAFKDDAEGSTSRGEKVSTGTSITESQAAAVSQPDRTSPSRAAGDALKLRAQIPTEQLKAEEDGELSQDEAKSEKEEGWRVFDTLTLSITLVAVGRLYNGIAISGVSLW